MANDSSGEGSPVVGVWRLVSFEFRQYNGEVSNPLGTDLRGRLIYTVSGEVSAQLIPPNRPRFASGDQEVATAEEVAAAFKHCTSYFGRYELDLDAQRVVHHVEASLYPNYEGQELVRFFRLEGNRLEITTAPVRWGGAERVAALVWERVEP